jgi:hypothetical protein
MASPEFIGTFLLNKYAMVDHFLELYHVYARPLRTWVPTSKVLHFLRKIIATGRPAGSCGKFRVHITVFFNQR